MNPEKILLAMLANQQETTRFLLALLEKERKHSTEREHETWKRSREEVVSARQHADAAVKDVMRTKIVARTVNTGHAPPPVQQVMPFAVNGAGPKSPRMRPGIDDAATP